MKETKNSKYGGPPSPKELPKPRKRLPQYDECLREFLASGDDIWAVKMDALPSKSPRVVLSSLKWRIKNKEEFIDKQIQVFMHNSKVFIERTKK